MIEFVMSHGLLSSHFFSLAYLAGVPKHAADDTQRAAPGQGLQQRIGEEQGTHQIWVGRVIQKDDKTASVAQTSGIYSAWLIHTTCVSPVRGRFVWGALLGSVQVIAPWLQC